MISFINDDNFMNVAMKVYDNPSCRSVQEFQDDLDRSSLIKKHIKKYLFTKKIKERLLLNHIIIFCNVFTPVTGTRLLFSVVGNQMYPVLKTFLVFLNYADDATVVPECETSFKNIPLDNNIHKLLQNIKET